jgi:hypothetical protein
MTILITTLPDDPKEWAGWLEQHLVGIRLRDLIDELRLLPDSTSTRLKSLLNDQHLSEVRKHGLSALTVNQIQALLGSPESLLELQEDVLFNGGDYWTSRPPVEDVMPSIERVRRQLKQASSPDELSVRQIEHKSTHRSRTRSIIGLMSAAAILLIGVIAWRFQPAGSGSILGRPEILANNVSSSSQYLNRIADAGSEWFDLRPADTTQLITLLEQVSGDCQILIDAEHLPLTPAEREWFVAKCQSWKSDFDSTLASLRSGDLPLEAAQSAADQTMLKLVNALRAGPNA